MTNPTAPLPDEELVAIEARDEMLWWKRRRGSLWVKRMTEDWQTPTTEELDIHRLLAALRAERAARTLPPHTRLVLAGETILDDWGTRTEDGDLLTVEWGEQQPGGWYEPTFTRHSDDNPLRAERAALYDAATTIHEMAVESGYDTLHHDPVESCTHLLCGRSER